ncbi:alpha/beta fold hydrolase [Planococcus kocurii]|uniref:alpha/beta fold hydrolase n=1 Tax=Planococcus kocurii TaxID=1374 RepID=UPI003CFF52A7
MQNGETMKVSEFKARQKSVMLDGIIDEPVRINYTDVGAGPPLLLLHGIPTWSYLYQEMIEELQKEYRVIAPDMLGYGWSDRRDRFDRSLHVQAKVITGLMDRLELEKIHFVGHDIGGGVGLVLAVDSPDRLESLILSNNVAYDSWPIEEMMQLGHPSWTDKPVHKVSGFLEKAFTEGLLNKEQQTSAFLEGIVEPYQDEEGKKSLVRNAAALNTNETTMLTHKLSAIQHPTLILWGVQDPWQKLKFGEKLHEDIPNSKLVTIEHSGHWLPQDAPKEFAAEIKSFLQKKE